MINGNVIVQSSQLLQNGIRQKVLTEGSQVLVRIISEKGNGKYEGSVAGVRVSISSAKTLKPGESFPATVSVKNGQIFVTPKTEQTLQNANHFELTLVQNQNISAFMEALGLPADELSYHLLQQMKQLEMKYDNQLLNKIRNLSVKFGGKQKSAAQLLMILSKKGINFTQEEFLQLLDELDLERDSSQNKDDFPLLNRINEKKENWQLLPYEIISGNSEALACGVLRILFNRSNLIELLNVECKFKESNNLYFFSVEYKNGKCSCIKMNAGNVFNEELYNQFVQKIRAAGITVPVEWCERELIEGTACGNEEFYAFGGNF